MNEKINSHCITIELVFHDVARGISDTFAFGLSGIPCYLLCYQVKCIRRNLSTPNFRFKEYDASELMKTYKGPKSEILIDQVHSLYNDNIYFKDVKRHYVYHFFFISGIGR